MTRSNTFPLLPVLRRLARIAGGLALIGALAACNLADTLSGTPEGPVAVVTDQRTSAPVAVRPASSLSQQRLAPGDVVQVFVFGNPELSQTATLGPDGSFRYPLIGEVRAEGRTLRDLEAIITSRLTQNIVNPQVSVSLSDLRSYRVFVDGEVLQPGAFDLDGPVTLVQAIAMAGGFTAFADRDQILLYNPRGRGQRRFVFNYDAFLRQADAPDITLEPGDTVIVP